MFFRIASGGGWGSGWGGGEEGCRMEGHGGGGRMEVGGVEGD